VIELCFVCHNSSIVSCVVYFEVHWDLYKCQETSSSVLLVWRLAVGASRQVDGTQTSDSGHSASRAPGGM